MMHVALIAINTKTPYITPATNAKSGRIPGESQRPVLYPPGKHPAVEFIRGEVEPTEIQAT